MAEQNQFTELLGELEDILDITEQVTVWIPDPAAGATLSDRAVKAAEMLPAFRKFLISKEGKKAYEDYMARLARKTAASGASATASQSG